MQVQPAAELPLRLPSMRRKRWGPVAPVLNALDAAPHTDLYVKFQGADVVGMVLVQAAPRDLNIVALSGDLSPLDLLHLRGHFGIPRFAGDGFTPSDN
jgi:hypothetical protein